VAVVGEKDLLGEGWGWGSVGIVTRVELSARLSVLVLRAVLCSNLHTRSNEEQARGIGEVSVRHLCY
jgi:hypothetical protein